METVQRNGENVYVLKFYRSLTSKFPIQIICFMILLRMNRNEEFTRVRHEFLKPIYFNIEIKYLRAFEVEFKHFFSAE